MTDSGATLLRQRIAAVERASSPRASVPLPAACGHGGIDAALGGGFARARLHEFFAGAEEDSGSASGFAAIIASLIGGTVFWLREARAQTRGGCLHAPGLAELGLDPARLILAVLDDAESLLKVAHDVVRCPEIGTAVIELWRRPRALDLTASRRLAVAAERSGVTPLLLRAGAEPAPSAAQTRWRVAASPAAPLAAQAPGFATFDLSLLRQRAGPAGLDWRVEWDREQKSLRDAPLPGALSSPSGGGPVAPHWRAAG